MKKLIQGIIEFRRRHQKTYQENFGRLVRGQNPDSLFIACSDSRVVPNTFASTNPGDLFVIRNVGNLVPTCCNEPSSDGVAESAAIDFAMQSLRVSDIIVCGHSECGAMSALSDGLEKLSSPHLRNWLSNGKKSLEKLEDNGYIKPNFFHLSRHNQLSQINTLQQLDNLMTYPTVRSRVESGELQLHAWWFDIATADVFYFNQLSRQFQLIGEGPLKDWIFQDSRFPDENDSL
jgi:carbonic anhydrase